MNKNLVAAGFASLLLASSALAGTPTDGFYGSLGAGANYLEDITPTGGLKRTFDPDLAASASAGYGFGNGFRTQLTYLFERNELRDNNPSGLSGHYMQHAVMAEGLYDFTDLTPYFTPYIGGGVGVDFLKASGANADYRGRLAYNAIGGGTVPLDDNWKIGLEYRYLRVERPNSSDADSHIALVTLRYEFTEPEPAAAPAPPPPPPVIPPAPPQVQQPEAARQFQVFFDFDKSDLTDAASKVVQDAANAVKQGNPTEIDVVGHTDTVGSVKYNQALSERRAEAVKEALIADGVSSSNIMASGVGKTDLLVATKDGVRDPQNRRAVISLK